MKHLAKKILKNLKEENDVIPEQVNENIPNYKEIKDHKQSLETMNSYLEELVKSIKSEVDISTLTKTQDALKMAEEILKDPKFIQQKGIRSLIDQDARVGYKSKTDSFFGYKVEYAMIPEERIITAVNVHDGAYVDGTEYKGLYINTRKCGLNIKQAYGDKAYFRKPILDILKNDNVEVIIPVSESAYRIDESKFSYNKDSDQWFCSTGNHTVKKVRKREKRGNETLSYYFNKEVCKNCSIREGCINGKHIGRTLIIGVNTPEFYEYNQISKTQEFLEKYKKRASQEWKNGEMKRFHGMDRARGYGLKSMQTQAKLTALAVNLKRIAGLVSSYYDRKMSPRYTNFHFQPKS